MKLIELSTFDRDRLRFEARPLTAGPRSDLTDEPTGLQLYALSVRGYIIGKDGAVLRRSTTGLRECKYGIPCSYFCEGRANGECVDIEFPACGVADGACLFTGKPCNAGCKSGG